MRKSKTLRLLVTVTIPVRTSPEYARRIVRDCINNAVQPIRAKKVVPATQEQFERVGP